MSKVARTSSGTSRGATVEQAPDTKHVGERLVERVGGKELRRHRRALRLEHRQRRGPAAAGDARDDEGHRRDRGKNRWWFDNQELHAATAEGPLVNGDRFAVHFRYDFTPKIGGSKGKRTKMEEVAVYTVRDGKIVHEAFFS